MAGLLSLKKGKDCHSAFPFNMQIRVLISKDTTGPPTLKCFDLRTFWGVVSLDLLGSVGLPSDLVPFCCEALDDNVFRLCGLSDL
jgi:hypothetical protein